MIEKRFEIIKSAIIDGARVIKDNENKYTFATTFETATLINYRKALNELNDENKKLKKDFDSFAHNWALLYDEAKNKVEELSKENKKLKSINSQIEDRLEESGIGIALKMEDLE